MYTLIPAGGADRPPRKVIFLGLRGIPEIQGGVETHVAALAVRIAQRGWRVEVLGRKPYLPSPEPYVWKEVTVTPVWAWLLYTSDATVESRDVDLGGRTTRKKTRTEQHTADTTRHTESRNCRQITARR